MARTKNIGPHLENNPVWVRYGAAVTLMVVIAFARMAMTPGYGQRATFE